MVYPSHYGRGAYGIPHPKASPYKTVFIGLKAGMKRLKGTDCKMRPWLQDFSLGGVRYGEKQVRDQIRAARDNGVHEYLLWNASNRYTTAALVPPRGKKNKRTRKQRPQKRRRFFPHQQRNQRSWLTKFASASSARAASPMAPTSRLSSNPRSMRDRRPVRH
jgi:hypothetical protein